MRELPEDGPIKDPIDPKDWPIKSVRFRPSWLAKLSYLARHDTAKTGTRITESHLIRRAVKEMFERRENLLYPKKEGAK